MDAKYILKFIALKHSVFSLAKDVEYWFGDGK